MYRLLEPRQNSLPNVAGAKNPNRILKSCALSLMEHSRNPMTVGLRQRGKPKLCKQGTKQQIGLKDPKPKRKRLGFTTWKWEFSQRVRRVKGKPSFSYLVSA
ncbi:hypothetical protein V6N12_062752 [Hibiscus sabdariffa]|uniref:Uncharacterized protein n=1 Tax=Hibiscus sabdariffa TaxID=183260 RepID=A0ABR2F9R9_9ROSI